MYNRLVLEILWSIFRVLYRLGRRGVRPRPRPDEVRSVLLISTTGLGDTVMSTAAFAAARKSWPRAKINALLHRRWADLLTVSPYLDRIIIYPGKFKGVRRVLREIQGLGADAAVILHGNDPDILPLAYLSGAGFVVGPAESRFAFLLDRAVDFSNPERHYVERRVDMIRAAAGSAAPEGEQLFLSDASREWALNFWRDRGLKAWERLIVLNPGGSHQAKRWPDGHWHELIDRLAKRAGTRIALFGSPAERTFLETLASGGDVLIVTRPSPLEAASLLERAEVMIGPDSGLAHVAVSLGIPALILFGPDNPVLTGPMMNRARAEVLQAGPGVCPDLAACRKKNCRIQACMIAITPQAVIETLERKFENFLDSPSRIE